MKLRHTLILLAISFTLFAQNGTLDPTFDQDGIAKFNLPNTQGDTKAVVIQPDGKIIASALNLIRVMPDGLLDPTFGTNGIVLFSPQQPGSSSDLALQTDGKIIAVGGRLGNSAVVRYLSSGMLDTTFGVGGVVNLTMLSTGSALKVAIQQDGKILVAGYEINNPPDGTEIFVCRLLPDGTTDVAFGTSGFTFTDIQPGSGLGALERVFDLVVKQNGKIVVVGVAGQYAMLCQYLDNGMLDQGFGTNGIVLQNLSLYGNSAFSGIAIQPDQKIVAAGFEQNGAGPDLMAARFDALGDLDSSFATNGVIQVSLSPQQDFANDVIVQPDGKILIGGGLSKSNVIQYALIRYDAAGNPDLNFGMNGVVETKIDSIMNYLGAISLQSDGKIVAAGGVGTPRLMCLTRYNSMLVSVTDPDEFLAQFSVYPNPFLDELRVAHQLHGDALVKLELVDQLGRVLYRAEEQLSELDGLEGLPAGLLPGVYYLVLGVEGEQATYKLVRE